MTVRKIGMREEWIDPNRAQWYLDNYLFPGQRKIRPKRVTLYANYMVAEKWDAGNIIAMVKLGDQWYLINGQHQLLAVIRSGKTILFQIWERECDTMQEVAELYGHQDTHGVRTIGDAIRAYGIERQLGINYGYLIRLAPGLGFMEDNFFERREIVDADNAIRLIELYQADLQCYVEILEDAVNISSAMLRSSTIAVAVATLHYSAVEYGLDKVENFWGEVATGEAGEGEGLKIGDPARIAREHLLKTKLNRATYGTGGISSSVTRMYQSRFLAECVNAYLKNRKPKRVNVEKEDAPLFLLGTSWTGK